MLDKTSGGDEMKGYYKNWYQHYLEIEEEKKKAVQRGYYANLEPKSMDEKKPVVKKARENSESQTMAPKVKVAKSKAAKKSVLPGLLFPVFMLAGFVFLWYQLDIGPVRSWTGDALMMIGAREEPTVETVDVLAPHTELLALHEVFISQMVSYIQGEFDDFSLLLNEYDQMLLRHDYFMAQIAENEPVAVNDWREKVASVSQMMVILNEQLVVDDEFAQFLTVQDQLTDLIHAQLDGLEQ